MSLTYEQQRVLLALTDELVPAGVMCRAHDCSFDELFHMIDDELIVYKDTGSMLLIAISEAGKIERTKFATGEQIEHAKLLISSVASALARGVKHFDKAGQELPDVKSILVCLVNEGGVTLLEPKS